MPISDFSGGLLRPPEVSAPASGVPAPRFGIASVLMPLVLAVISRALDNPRVGSGMNGYAGMFLVAFIYIGIVLGSGAGVVMGIVAWIRRERYQVLGVIGVVLNVVATGWLLHGC